MGAIQRPRPRLPLPLTGNAREDARRPALARQTIKEARVARFTSCGGGIDQTAVIGHPPEYRDWTPEDPMYEPKLGVRVRIEAFVSVDAGVEVPTEIGDRTWLMKHVHVGHDARVGMDCELSPGVVVGGYCNIGHRVKIGVNACLRPHINVGRDAVIGAGAVVVKDVPPGEVWAGNPAAFIRSTVEAVLR